MIELELVFINDFCHVHIVLDFGMINVENVFHIYLNCNFAGDKIPLRHFHAVFFSPLI